MIAEIRSLYGPPHPTRPNGGGGATGPDGVKIPSQKTRTRRSTPGGRESAAGARADDQRVPSRDPDDAASDPGVRDAVGLGAAETEASTAVGAEVEGGGR